MRDSRGRMSSVFWGGSGFGGDESLFRVCHALVQAAMFSGNGASLREMSETLGKSRGTVESRLKKIPANWLIKDVSARQHWYKFNVLVLRGQF